MSTPADTSVVSIKGLTKSFRTWRHGAGRTSGSRSAPGEFVSLIGPSGCGKSTLLRVIGDLIQPTSGQVLVNGKSAHQARLDHDYGIVFQDAVLYDWRTWHGTSPCRSSCCSGPGAAQAACPGDARARRADRLRVEPSVAAVGRHAAAGLDRGEPSRSTRRCLLMDEPFGALDEMTRER
jgi:NitT/TauT family transport system ATP-binding protein